MPKVLIIDDDAPIVATIADVCADEGWETAAALGMAALDLAEAGNVDVILLDMMMPPPDGTEMLTLLQESPAAKHIPIIIETAVGHIGDAGRSLGAFAVLEKPFGLDELVETIRRALGEDG